MFDLRTRIPAIIALPIAFGLVGCNRISPLISQPTAAPISTTATRTIPTSPTITDPPPPGRASIPNPIFHPGTTVTLDMSGTYTNQDGAAGFSGTGTYVCTSETAHGKPVFVSTFTFEFNLEGGRRVQLKGNETYEKQSDGNMKLVSSDIGEGSRWVESNTCPSEPLEYNDGYTSGGDVHYDDGFTENRTTVVTRNGDYLKVTTTTKGTRGNVQTVGSDAIWFDVATGKIVRWAGKSIDSDGVQIDYATK